MIRLIGINLAILFIALAGLEIAARAYNAFATENGTFFRQSLFTSPWFTTVSKPYPVMRHEGERLVGEFDHRENKITAEKPEGTLRIVAIGGSTTKNQNAWRSGQTDYAKELERSLQGIFANHKVEVLNAGGEGYSSAHSLVNYALRISAFSPDLIIVMHNANDRSAAVFGDATMPDYSNKYMHPTYLAPEVQRFSGVYGTLVQSRLLSHLGIARIFAQREIKATADSNDALEFFHRNMKNLAAIAMNDGVDVLFLTQPYNTKTMQKEFHAPHVMFNKVVKSISTDSEAHYFDLSARLSDVDGNFTDPIHYSVAGVKNFAAAIQPTVQGILQQRVSGN